MFRTFYSAIEDVMSTFGIFRLGLAYTPGFGDPFVSSHSFEHLE